MYRILYIPFFLIPNANNFLLLVHQEDHPCLFQDLLLRFVLPLLLLIMINYCYFILLCLKALRLMVFLKGSFFHQKFINHLFLKAVLVNPQMIVGK